MYALGIWKCKLPKQFKVYQNISLPIFNKIFHRRNKNYNLRINSEFAIPKVSFVFHGSGSILCFKILDIVPLKLERINKCYCLQKKALKTADQKKIHVGYLRNIYQMKDSSITSCTFFITFLTFAWDLLYLKFPVNLFVKIFFIFPG